MSEFSLNDSSLDDVFGGDFDAPEPEAPQPEETIPAEVEGVEAAPPQPEQPQEQEETQPENWNPEGPGNVREALRQAREEARIARQQAEQYAAFVAQMQANQQPAQPKDTPPDFFEDPDAAFQYRLEQAQRPLMEKLAQYESVITQQQQAAELDALERDHPGAKALVEQFDQMLPQAANALDAKGKAAFVLGFQMLDPNARKNVIAKDVQAELARLQPSLQPQQPKAPKGLGGIPAAATGSDSEDLTPEAIKRLGIDALDRL